MSRDMTYLTRELNVEVDQFLWRSTTHGELNEDDLRKPPGIKNLEAWGNVKAPSGKRSGKTFRQIYEEEKMYMNQIWNRSAVTSWVRSLQLYGRHRRAASLEATKRAMEANPDWEKEENAKLKAIQNQWQGWRPASPKASPEKGPQTPSQMPITPASSHSWVMVSPKQTEGYMKTENKRPKEVEKEMMSDNMSVERDPEKIQQLQTKIAILQRELNKELGQSQSTPATSSGTEAA